MVPEPVVRAIIKLEGLLDEPGVSRAVARALRRALDRLRAVAAGGGRDAELAALRAASGALAACEAEIGPSALAADRALGEVISKVQRSINRLLGPTTPAPPPPRIARPGALGPPAALPPRAAGPPRMLHERVPLAPPRPAGPPRMLDERVPLAPPRPAPAPVAHPAAAPTAPGRAPPPEAVSRLQPAPPASPAPPPKGVAGLPQATPAGRAPSPDVVARLPQATPAGRARSPDAVARLPQATPAGRAPSPDIVAHVRPAPVAPPPVAPPPLAPRPAAPRTPEPWRAVPREAVPRQIVPAASAPLERRPAPRPPLTNDIAAKGERLAQEMLARLSGDYDRRANLLVNPLLRWERLAQVDVPLARDGMVLAWMDEPTAAALRRLVAQSDDDARPALDRALRSVSPGDEATAREKLLADLDDPDDDDALAAALALAWTGDTALAPPLLARAQAAASDARAAALLFASVALGSSAALAEARARVAASDDADPRLYDALAIAGGDGDADRLLRHAARASEPNRVRAVLAIGHLGSARATAELAKLEGTVDAPVLDEALQATFGDAPGGGARRAASPGRLLRGRPWSIDGVVTRLSAPNEPVRSRERLALDLAVRTGLRPPVRYDPTALAARQTRAAESFRAAFAPSATALRPGHWYYFGYPVP